MLAFESLYGGQFTLSTQFIKTKLSCYTPHRHSTTVALETYPSIHLCFTRTGNYRIDEFDWLKSMLKAVYIFPARPVTFWVLSISRPVRDKEEYPSKMERHFPIKPGKPIGMALANFYSFSEFPN